MQAQTNGIRIGLIVIVVLMAGCAGLVGSPKLSFEGQAYQETSFSETELGYEGSIANTGDAPAKNVSIEFKAELSGGHTYRGVTYLGTIDDGESVDYSVGFRVTEADADLDWRTAQWYLIIRGDNVEDEVYSLTK